jgi:hypothetical protein
MSSHKACPECGSTDRRDEQGEFALVQLTSGRMQLHIDRPNTQALVVRALTCGDCGHVAFFHEG